MRVLFLIFLLSLNVTAADMANGKAVYAKCIQCHGIDGMGSKLEQAPRIKGQFDWYLVKALKEFKSGVRKNPQMDPIIKGLSTKDFEDVAAYISKEL